jgi:hypothetical protein
MRSRPRGRDPRRPPPTVERETAKPLIVDHDPRAPDDPSQEEHEYFPAPRLRRTRRRRKPGGLALFALRTAAIGVTLVLALAAFGVAYMREGPISLDSLRPTIADNLQSRLKPGYRVELGPVSLSNGLTGLGVGFRGLMVRDAKGRLVVNAPGGRIGLDALALLGLQVKVRRLELDGLQLALRVGANGQLSLAAGEGEATPIPLGPTPAAPAANNFGAVVAEVANVMAGIDQPLDHVALVNGRLIVMNAGRPSPTVYDHLRLAFDRSGAAASAKLSAHGPSGDWSVSMRAGVGTERTLIVDARQLAIDDFTRLIPNPPQFSFDSPISFTFSATASPQGVLSALEGGFSLGAGRFDPRDPDGGPPIAIDEASAKVSLDAAGRYALDRGEALSGASRVRFNGWFAPPTKADPLWRVHMHSGDALFAAARAGDPEARLTAVDLDAHIDAAAATFETDSFTARGPDLSGRFGARFRIGPAGPELKLDLVGSGSLLRALRLWPTFINPDARQWCIENVRGGELVSGSLKIDWDAAAFAAVLNRQAPPAESVDGHFVLRDAAAVLLPGLPVATGLAATGTITGRRFEVAASRGAMDLGAGRKIAGTNLSFVVPDTKPVPRMPALGAGRITGGADALAALLSLDALKRYVGVSLDPAAIKGQFQGDLKLDLTLGKNIEPEAQKFHVAGALSGLAVDKFIGPTKLEQGALQVAADSAGLKMTGTGQVFGAPARLEVSKTGREVGAMVVTGALDEAARARLGFQATPPLKGPVTLKLTAPLDRSGAAVEIDLAKATMEAFGGPPWKPAGRPGKASFSLKQAPQGVEVSDLVIDAGSLVARGSALFAPDGLLQSLKFTSLRMSPSDDLRLDLVGGKTEKLTLRGASLDARGLVKSLTGAASQSAAADLDIDVKVGAAIGYNRQKITGLELTALRRNGVFSQIDARGRLGSAALSVRGHGGDMLVKSADAGALSRFLDLYDKLDGGAIELSVRNDAGVMSGQVSIKRFAILNEPSLHKLELSVPTRQNLPRGGGSSSADPSAPERFDRLKANYSRSGGELQVRDAVVSNSFYGLTVQGYIDFDKDKLDLNGVYVPFYQFNNVIGGIPLLGAMLTGGQNEGIFGVNYRVTGPASRPTLTVNPLSPFAPGFLRKVFGAIDGTTPPATDSDPSAFAPNR